MKLRNELPGLELALESVNGLEHLQSPDKVNLLVSKFDERTFYEWEYFKSKTPGKMYDRFFAFILDRYDSCRSITAHRRNNASSDGGSESVNHANIQFADNGCFKCRNSTTRGALTCPACNHTVL